MTLDMDTEGPAHTIARLQRELDHVSEQARVSHAMAMSWKARALVAEEQVRRLEQRLRRREAPDAPPEPMTDESGDAALSLL